MNKIFAILIIACSLSSCVTSLQPLVTVDNIVTDQRITGNWISEKQGICTITTFDKSEYGKSMENLAAGNVKPAPLSAKEKGEAIMFSKMYMATFREDSAFYHMAIMLTKLNGQLFACVYPAAMQDETKSKEYNDPYSLSQDYLPGFTVAKVEMNGSAGMTMKFIDGEFVMTQIKEGRMKLKHESNDLFGTFMVTASTDELRQFISKYGNDERIFGNNTSVTFTRKLNL